MLTFNLHLNGDEQDLKQVLAGLTATFGGAIVPTVTAIATEEVAKPVKTEKKTAAKTEAPKEPEPTKEPETKQEETNEPETTAAEAAEALDTAPAGVTFEMVQKKFAEFKGLLAGKNTDLQVVNDKLKALREEAAPGSKALTDMRKDEFKHCIPNAFVLIQNAIKANA